MWCDYLFLNIGLLISNEMTYLMRDYSTCQMTTSHSRSEESSQGNWEALRIAQETRCYYSSSLQVLVDALECDSSHAWCEEVPRVGSWIHSQGTKNCVYKSTSHLKLEKNFTTYKEDKLFRKVHEELKLLIIKDKQVRYAHSSLAVIFESHISFFSLFHPTSKLQLFRE